MKKLICVLVLALCINASGASFSLLINSTSVTVAPVRSTAAAVIWAAGRSYKQGQIVRYGAGYFMVEDAIANSSTTPDAAPTLYRKLYSNKERDSVVIRNWGPDTVWVNVGEKAEVGRGMYLLEDDTMTIAGIQASVHVVSEGSSRVTGVDVVAD